MENNKLLGWVLIYIGTIILICIVVSSLYKVTSERFYEIGYDEGYKIGYDEKTCKYIHPVINPVCASVCPRPNADKLCEGRYHPMCVGEWQIINEKCQWVC